MRKARQKHHYKTNALVILPNHLHAMWTLPSGDCDYSGRWRHIKQNFTKAIKQYEPILKNKRGEYQLWQQRF
jgi:REP-associated tyrosine transposase